MRKKPVMFFLVLAYVVILLGLLLLQLKAMEGGVAKLIANLATLVLVFPVFFLLKAYIRLKEKEAEQEKQERLKLGKTSPEELREQIYVWMEQQGLSAREQEVAWLIYCGYTNLQIAEELFISETTVKKHASHIYEKLQVSGRKEFRAIVGCEKGEAFM